jgi:hypothetical protein
VSPDRSLVDQFPESPQSWNLYVYCRNNPLVLYDDDGRKVESIKVLFTPGDPNKVQKQSSPQVSDASTLGPKQIDKANGWYWVINVEAQLTPGDNAKDYNAYLWVLPNEESKYGQEGGKWSNDSPGGEYVTRENDSVVFSDNPGLEVTKGPPAGVGQDKPAVFSAIYAGAVIPKKGISRSETPPWKLPADTKIVLYRVDITVVKGQMDLAKSKVTVFGTTTAGEYAKRLAAAEEQRKKKK